MKTRRLIVLAAALSGCGPGVVVGPSVPARANVRTATFLGTVINVDAGNTRHPYLKWVVTLKVDQVVSGPSPGEGFWFAVHSPSMDGVEVGQRYRISIDKKGDDFDLDSMTRERLDGTRRPAPSGE